ncbi:MAG: MBL fold metallo-hydrolase [Clostridiales bacterium]|nr:MBL fold metallo-hydrolase [Clostridiales bacterium]
MRVINLSSGSKGNLTYIESMDKKIILDIGLSCQEACNRLDKCGISPQEIDAIIITHEHSDHIKGLDIFSSRFNTPVYAHHTVWQGLDSKLVKVRIENRKHFEGDFSFGSLTISPIEVPHDVSCFSFSFLENQNKISILTDLGHTNDRILNAIKGSQIVYLEANYDRDLLMKGTKYPYSLKRRIDGPNGHLSNLASSEVIEFLAKTGTRQVILSHLSEENNSPLLAYKFITNELSKKGIIEGQDIRIDVATQNIGAFFRLKRQ